MGKYKSYGSSYSVEGLTPLHRFVKKDSPEFRFYSNHGTFILYEVRKEHKQRVVINSTQMTNIMSMLDKNGWQEVRA